MYAMLTSSVQKAAGPFTGVYVSSAPEGGCAWGSGVRRGMRVVAVNGHNASELPNAQFVQLLADKKELVLTLKMDLATMESQYAAELLASGAGAGAGASGGGGGASSGARASNGVVKEGILKKKATGFRGKKSLGSSLGSQSNSGTPFSDRSFALESADRLRRPL